MKKIQIDYSQIRKIDMKILCHTTLAAIKRFYDNPENCKAFEVWKAERSEKDE